MTFVRSCSRVVGPFAFSLVLTACSVDLLEVFDEDGPAAGGAGTGGDPSAGGGPSTGGSSSDGGSSSNGGSSSDGGSSSNGGAPPAGCGDGVLDPDEQCDGASLGGATCEDYGFSSPEGLGCTASCNHDPSGCQATCDGDLLEPGETCDGSDLGGTDCTAFGYESGFGLGCTDDCSGFDTSFCFAQCGNDVLEPDEVCDGDQSTMSCTDFGFSNATPGQPSCTFFCDVDPSDCEGTCGDGAIEPDESCDDGNTVSGDGCSSSCLAEGGDCGSTIPVALNNGQQTFTGNTLGGASTLDTNHPLCAAGASGPSRTYAVTAGAAGFLTAWLNRPQTTFNSVLYARTVCNADPSTLLCADNSVAFGPVLEGGGEVISFPINTNETVYITVDGATALDFGDFSLTLDLSEGRNCTDPIPLPIWSGSPMTVLGNTIDKSASGGGSCGGGGVGSGSDDVVYRVDRRSASITNMTYSLPAEYTTYDSILYGRFDCGSNEISCNDSPDPTGGEEISLDFQNNNIRYVWVDGYQGAEGTYGMEIVPTP